MNFKENLKRLRKEQNITQKELAKLLNMKRDTIASLELGRSKPSYDTIINLQKIFNCSFDDLLKWGVFYEFQRKFKKINDWKKS